MDLSEWIKVSSSFDHADFVTHANYLRHTYNLSKGLVLTCNRNFKKAKDEDRKIKTKIKLINLTSENLKEEFNTIKRFPEYSIVCTSWMPVKSYYLIFNLLIILEYLMTMDSFFLQSGHKKVLRKLKDSLTAKELSFSVPEFNAIHNAVNITNWKIPPRENIKRMNVNLKIRYKQIIRKLLDYKKDDFKRERKIKRLAGKRGQEFMNSTTVNLCEFFYWYRIKANYRDMEFIDKGVPTGDFESFYSDYYGLTENFYNALERCVNTVSIARFGKQLLNEGV